MDSAPKGCASGSKLPLPSANSPLRKEMGQAKRTTKLLLDLGKRQEGGANTGKRAYLDETAQVLNEGRGFYIEFFLAHAEKFKETVVYYSNQHLEMRERLISAHELLSLLLKPPRAKPP